MRQLLPFILRAALLLCACNSAAGQSQTYDTANVQWTSYAGDIRGTNYSSLALIDANNFNDLKRAWQWTPSDAYPQSSRLQVTPLMVDGALYFNTPLWQGVAIDAATGDTVWVSTPTHSLAEILTRNRFWSPTGVAYWADGDQHTNRIFWDTGDGYLICADAHTGRPCLDFGPDGTGRLDTLAHLALDTPDERNAMLTFAESGAGSPPIVVNDSVIYSGQISTDRGLQVSLGAWNARTGDRLWHFGAPRSSDWAAGDAIYGATGASKLAADNELVYLPTALGTDAGPGLSPAVIAVNAATGEAVWGHEMARDVHFPLYNFHAHPNVVSSGGAANPVGVAQISTDGFVRMFDRSTGAALWGLSAVPPPAPQRVAAEVAAFGQPAWASAFDPATETLYVASRAPAPDSAGPPSTYYGMAAIDVTFGERIWFVSTGDDTRTLAGALAGALTSAGVANSCPSGPLATMTLLIECSTVGGTNDGPRLVAYNKEDGGIVGSLDLPSVAIATPMTYMVGDLQYITVAIDGNRLVSYAHPTDQGVVGVALTGWDMDEDGLRDDVREAIRELYGDAGTRNIMNNGTRAYQRALLASTTNLEDDDASAAEAIARFIWCLNEHPGINSGRELARLRSLVLDTEARYTAYERFDAGRQYTLPRVIAPTAEQCMGRWR